ncbi:MAG: DUF6151 family protein [Sulfitobacter sp.]
MKNVAISCACAKINGAVIGVSPRTGNHAQCFCRSCRAGHVYCGAPDPAPGPVALFQTTPDRLRIDGGMDHLRVFSFGPKNLLRWYAGCCGTPLFNTPRNPKISFIGINYDLFADKAPLGPLRGQAHIPAPGGKTRHKGLHHLLWGGMSRAARHFLSGDWRHNLLFDAKDGLPIIPVVVVCDADRRALLPKDR